MDVKKIKLAAEKILEKKKGVAFTGAGSSTPSGIPDFRSPTGIWSRYNVREYAYIDSFLKNPKKVWEFFSLRLSEYMDADPNPGHYALAELEELGLLKAVITQNIDMLHSKAGNKKVYELHGTMSQLACLECAKKYPKRSPKVKWDDYVPFCECGAILKPDVVMFGEGLPQEEFSNAVRSSLETDFMIITGTSGVVFPAAQIPYMAKKNGSFIIEVNREGTPFTDSITDIFLQGPLQDLLPDLVKKVKQLKDTR